jgi:hypothetical protein
VKSRLPQFVITWYSVLTHSVVALWSRWEQVEHTCTSHCKQSGHSTFTFNCFQHHGVDTVWSCLAKLWVMLQPPYDRPMVMFSTFWNRFDPYCHHLIFGIESYCNHCMITDWPHWSQFGFSLESISDHSIVIFNWCCCYIMITIWSYWMNPGTTFIDYIHLEFTMVHYHDVLSLYRWYEQNCSWLCTRANYISRWFIMMHYYYYDISSFHMLYAQIVLWLICFISFVSYVSYVL